MRVLYDGWSLATAPNSPAALHLLDVLAALPETVEAVVAIPGRTKYPVGRTEIVQAECTNTPGDRLRWEQRLLPMLFRATRSEVKHLFSLTAALFGTPPTVISPATAGNSMRLPSSGWAGRLREALSFGALGKARAVLWPDDLPDPGYPTRLVRLPVLVSPEFNPADPPEAIDIPGSRLPETYILAHTTQNPAAWHRLLAAWSWAAGSIGELYPLVVLGVEGTRQPEFVKLIKETGLGAFVTVLPELPPQLIASLYRGCSAVVHLETAIAWGGPLRNALACAKPVVSVDYPLSGALVGEAAYLVDAGDSRLQGGAILTVVVEEEVAGRLSQAAKEKAAWWRAENFGAALAAAYRDILD